MALVWQQIAYYFFYMLTVYEHQLETLPLFQYSQRIKTMFAFGWKLLCASLLDTVYNNIYGLVIGRIYMNPCWATSNRGEQFPADCQQSGEPPSSPLCCLCCQPARTSRSV